MAVVQRQRAVHLKQIVLCPQEALQVLRVEAHHQRDVVKATQRRKGVLEYRLRPGVLFAYLKDLLKERGRFISK